MEDMRLPDIPLRHHRLVRTAAAMGTGALALVRRRDVSADNQNRLRTATAFATAGLTWLTGSSAFLGKTAGSSGLDEFLELFSNRGSGPARYATEPSSAFDFGEPVGDGDSDSWWGNDATVKSPAFFNAAAAVAAGAASWALWPLTERLAENVDSRLPPGVGRGLNAVVNGGLVALTAVLIDTIDDWTDDYEELNCAPVEIELPVHIHESVELLLSQPHPNSPATAEAVREQLASAQFFVWITYPDSLHTGDEPIVLEPEQVAALLEDEDIVSIDVRPDGASPPVVPARHTYPVTGITGSAETADGLQLRLEIDDGRLNSLDLSEPDEDPFEDMLTAGALRASVPGTLHPGKTDDEDEGAYISSLEITDEVFDDEVRSLERWPRPEALHFRVDGNGPNRE